MRHIIPISGKDSLETAIVQTTHQPDLPYEYIFNDVGSEFPETYQWLDKVEKSLGIQITRIGLSLEKLIENHGILPGHNSRFCTRQAKIEPMEKFVGKNQQAMMYYGLRADEPQRQGYSRRGKTQITPVYTLREMGLGIKQVLDLLDKRDLLPPDFYWPVIYDRVVDKIGNDDFKDMLSRWVFRSLFAGRSRSNCYHCFYQREYEWIYLLCTHPDLFYKAKMIEQTTGGDQYHWNRDKSLDQIESEKDIIIEKRAERVAKLISRLYQFDLFNRTFEEQTLMDTTSCGLLCGK